MKKPKKVKTLMGCVVKNRKSIAKSALKFIRLAITLGKLTIKIWGLFN